MTTLSTRELAAFVQKVAKLQPQNPPVYGSSRVYNGCTSCVPTLSGLGMGLAALPLEEQLHALTAADDLDDPARLLALGTRITRHGPWMWVIPSVLAGAGAFHLFKKSKYGTMLRRKAKKSRKARKARRARR